MKLKLILIMVFSSVLQIVNAQYYYGESYYTEVCPNQMHTSQPHFLSYDDVDFETLMATGIYYFNIYKPNVHSAEYEFTAYEEGEYLFKIKEIQKVLPGVNVTQSYFYLYYNTLNAHKILSFVIPTSSQPYIAKATSSISLLPGFLADGNSVVFETKQGSCSSILRIADLDSNNTNVAEDNTPTILGSSLTKTNMPEMEPFPNPISSGVLSLGRKSKQYQLYNSQGMLIDSGKEKSEVEMDKFESGIYLLIMDGVYKKIIKN